MKIYTIGFTKKTAEYVSQLAGFSKRDDLRIFSREICKAEYLHLPDLAPTQDIFKAYKKEGGDWGV